MCQRFVSMESEEKSLLGCNEQILDSSAEEDGSSPVIPSSPGNARPPELVKRPTRKWAAWTREEEECFFTALRQVGKNFQKITSRVKSKNKDQVRHYYYRLVRRMNKLLGPGLCLDAKNSRDTNAAMLRWWSLLEKYSCKASKLHLKPRRFKIFLEALEHQLLKDRKKNVKKQSSQGESSISPTSTCQNQIKSSGNDLRAVKAVTADGQNVEKLGNGKGFSTRRSSNLGITRSSNKGESSPTKPTRQRRKTGVVSTATLKKWEKAAMAGVSLVADAAEHVERTSGGNMASFLDGLTVLSAQAVGCTMEKNDPGPSGQQVQANSLIKLKLQLFPIDDNTRRALETDKHNPHLELTLSTRKKISSVLEHIGRKWGSSNVAAGELMLFPFDIQRENISGYQKWTRDSVATATDVYAMVGSPSIFRLRYGWVVASECQPATEKESPVGKDEIGKHDGYTSGDQPSTVSNAEKILEPTTGSNSYEIETVVDHRLKKIPTLSAGEWADSLTNVSTGDILPDAPDNAIPSCSELPVSRCLEELPFTCDSFDAAIAAHISSQYKSGFSRPSPCLSSIWDAEETCDEFTFRKSAVSHKQDPYPAMAAGSLSGEKSTNPSSANIDDLQDLAEETMAEDVSEEDQMDDCPSEPCEIGNLSKDFSSLTDIYWPESLGPLELDVPSCKYYSEGLILSDSMSGLNRLIASSLDAFQHFPLFGLDDKVPSPAPGAQLGASFTGKIGTGDSAGVPSLQV